MVEFTKDYQIWKQRYKSDIGPIPGVEILPLNRFNDETGSFMELMRLDTNGFMDDNGGPTGFKPRQVNYSILESLEIKAFHLHKIQTDVIFVAPESKVKLVLVDVREGNPRLINTHVLGDMKSQLIKVPPGVAHGFKNISTEPGVLIYFTDVYFTPDGRDPHFQEYRMDYNAFGKKIWDSPTD